MESETVAPSSHRAPTVIATDQRWIAEGEADALHGASQAAAAASSPCRRATADIVSPDTHSSRRSSNSSPPRSKRAVIARPR